MCTDHQYFQTLSAFHDFLDELFSLYTSFATTPDLFLITGDFKIHVNDSSEGHTIAFFQSPV